VVSWFGEKVSADLSLLRYTNCAGYTVRTGLAFVMTDNL
jgi:hypothetical protein